MRKEVQKAIEEFRRLLISREGNKIDKIMLYGSVVRGGYFPQDSDVDIMVFSSEKGIDEEILDIETKVSLKYGVVISALLSTGKELWEAKKAGYAFPDEVLRGKVLYERGKRRIKASG